MINVQPAIILSSPNVKGFTLCTFTEDEHGLNSKLHIVNIMNILRQMSLEEQATVLRGRSFIGLKRALISIEKRNKFFPYFTGGFRANWDEVRSLITDYITDPTSVTVKVKNQKASKMPQPCMHFDLPYPKIKVAKSSQGDHVLLLTSAEHGTVPLCRLRSPEDEHSFDGEIRRVLLRANDLYGALPSKETLLNRQNFSALIVQAMLDTGATHNYFRAALEGDTWASLLAIISDYTNFGFIHFAAVNLSGLSNSPVLISE